MNLEHPSSWTCGWCGGSVTDEVALADHQQWCMGDPAENTRLLTEVARMDGEITQEALEVAARQRRIALDESHPRSD